MLSNAETGFFDSRVKPRARVVFQCFIESDSSLDNSTFGYER